MNPFNIDVIIEVFGILEDQAITFWKNILMSQIQPKTPKEELI